MCVCVRVCLRVNVQDKISDGTHTKGDMILSTPNVVELVTKLHTVIQEVYRRMLPVHIKDRWEGEGREGKEGGEGSEGGRRGEGRREEKGGERGKGRGGRRGEGRGGGRRGEGRKRSTSSYFNFLVYLPILPAVWW